MDFSPPPLVFNFLHFSRLQIVWLFLTLTVFLPACLTLKFPDFLPFLNDLVKYGKVRTLEKCRTSFVRWIEVPKKWFSHFYIFASIWAFFCWQQLIFFYYFEVKPWPILDFVVEMLSKPKYGKRTVDEFGSILTLSLFFLHTVRRLTESVFVSVYSDTKMNVIHYAYGFAHYFLVPVTILAAAPGFSATGKFAFNFNALTFCQLVGICIFFYASYAQDRCFWILSQMRKNQEEFAFNFNALTFCQLVGICIFFYASYAQDRCFWILSQMRKNQEGNITNYAHAIPITYYFDLISCPHFLFEILIYFSLWLTANLSNPIWLPGVFLFVSTNQIAAALITHRWYKEKYKKMYPENRKALLPYLF